MKGDVKLEELIILVLEVILLIIRLKLTPEEATRYTAEKNGVAFSKLWRVVPKRWK